MKKLCIAALGLLSLPVLADNNQGFYLGLGGASIKDYQDGVDNMSRIGAVEVFGGYKYNDALGIEIRMAEAKNKGTSSYSVGVVDAQAPKTIERNITSFERSIENYRSIYYKPELVNDTAKLYALLGYSFVKTSGLETDTLVKSENGAWVTQSSKESRTSRAASGFSYGLGVGFVMDEHFNINFEYRNICNDISGKPNVISINVDYRFD